MPTPPARRLTPAAAILATSVAIATVILGAAARDSAPPRLQPQPLYTPTSAAQYGNVARLPDDPANPAPAAPNGR